MLRKFIVTTSLLAMISSVPPSYAADAWDEFWAGVERDRVRNQCWPEPFIALDRQASRAPIALMTAKAWQRQNLLGEHHFDKERHALSQAGQIKLHWILTQAPVEHRTVFVERALTEEGTRSRVDVVQEAAGRFVGKGDLPQVEISSMMSRGWPADYVDSIGRKYSESTPPPRLPARQSTTGGG